MVLSYCSYTETRKNKGTWQKLSVVFPAGGHVEDPGVAAQVQRQRSVCQDAVAHLPHSTHWPKIEALDISVADPDPGSGAFLTPRSLIRDG